MRLSAKVILLLLLFGSLVGIASADTQSAYYSSLKTITIDHTKVAADLNNFPVLVSLVSDADIGSKAQPSGYDIFFTSSDGTPLAYERESFTISGGLCNASIWVKVPYISNTSDTVIKLYYGNQTAVDGQNKSAVWDDGGSRNFLMVQHMNLDPSGTSQIYDSTTYHNDGTAFGSMTNGNLVSGKISKATSFNGNGNYIQINQKSSSLSVFSKSSNNPMIDGSFASIWYDDTGIYHAYYGYGYGYGTSIYHATSSDGKNWTIDSTHNPVMTATPGSWDTYTVEVPHVWKENSTWYMLYRGSNGATTARHIGLATSSDGVTWVKSSSNPVMSAQPSTWEVSVGYGLDPWGVIKIGSTYYLWYNTVNTVYDNSRATGLATSTDLIHWTRDSHNPIFTEGRYCIQPFKYGNYYYMLVPSTDDKIELYRDSNPTFYQNNREFLGTILYSTPGSWDSSYLDTPSVLTNDIHRDTFPDPNTLWMYYTGLNNEGTWQEGLATSPFTNLLNTQSSNPSPEISNAVTLEDWIKIDPASPTYSLIFHKNNAFGLGLHNINSEFYPIMELQTDLSWRFTSNGNIGITDGNWHHLAATYDSSSNTVNYYIDGQPAGSDTNNGYGPISSSSNNLSINYPTADYGTPGTFDEMRISNVARSSGWIKTEYINQYSPSTFYSIGMNISGNALPVANFTSNITNGSAPLAVQFNDSSLNATWWIWNFGDGTNISGNDSSTRNPVHTYSTAGNYIAILTVNNVYGNSSKSATINVTTLSGPVAGFNATPTNGTIPLTVQFNDTSTGSPTAWYWDFGDGTNVSGNNSSIRNPVHTYSTAGNYIANLTVNNVYGNSSKLAIINATQPQLPVADFSSFILGFNVQFTDLSKNANGWNWDFGDGASSTLQNPSHTYLSNGTYTVNLKASNAYGNNTTTRNITVNNTSSLYPDFPNKQVLTLSSNPGMGYQIPIKVTWQNSATLPMNTSFADLRFDDGVNKLNYWIVPDSIVTGSSCTVYVKLASSSTTLYEHWGNSAASSESNIVNTMELGDEFSGSSLNSSLWTGNAILSGGTVTIPQSYSIYSRSTFGRGYEIISRTKMSYTGTSDGGIGFWSSTNGVLMDAYTGNGYFQLYTKSAGAGSGLLTSIPIDTIWHNVRVSYNATPSMVFDTTTISKSTNVPSVSLPVYAASYITGSFDIDYVAVRKYSGADPNATFGPVPPVANFTSNVTNGTIPLTVQFNDQSTGYPTAWNWTFGDGTNSTLQSPVHTYSTVGNYTISLTVSNVNGTSTKTAPITVWPPILPVANFTSNVASGPAPLDVQFNDTSIGSPTAWSWNFGDGANSTQQSPVHTYSTAGNYIANLTVNNVYGNSSKLATINVTTPSGPVAGFNATPTNGTIPLTVQFNDTSTGSPTAWYWDFGDGTNVSGNNSSIRNPVHTYSTAGNYIANLTVNNVYGNSSKLAIINATQPQLPVADFSSFILGFNVQFTDLSKNANGWNWDFGDGASSTLQNPSHTYLSNGTYTVNLKASNTYGNNTTTRNITVNNTSSLYPDFPNKQVLTLSSNPGMGYQIPIKVTWQNSATLPMNTSFADLRFDDGFNKLNYWIVPDSIVTGSSCTVYVKLASNSTTLYEHWGNSAASSESNIVNTMELGDEFSGSSLNSSLWTGNAILSGGTITIPQSYSIYSRSTFGRGYEIISRTKMSYTGTSDGGIGFWSSTNGVLMDAYTGNGYFQLYTKSAGAGSGLLTSIPIDTIWHNVRVSYNATPSMVFDTTTISKSTNVPSVSLPVYAASYITGSFDIDYVAVRKYSGADPNATFGPVPPVANFTSNVTNGTIPLTVQFNDQSTGSPTAWNWAFGDGTNSMLQSPVHTYFAAGNYTVNLTVSNANGSNSKLATISVSVAQLGQPVLPVANFTSNVTSGPAPLGVQFNDNSLNATAWNWAFGDGTNSIQQSPVHIYSAAGNYAVNLTVSNANGSNSKLATISVSLAQLGQPVLPVANFTSNVTSGPAPLGVQFNDNSLNATAWNWAFGDGTNSAQQSPVHIYSAAGNYAVNLTVSNANGSNSKLATISVSLAQLEQPVLPVASFTSNVTSGPAPLDVQFNDNSLNSTAWNWAFGDGTNSAQQSPVHIYSAAGNYAVNLTVSNANGSNSKLATISVSLAQLEQPVLPVASFTSNVTSGPAPLGVQFNDNSLNATAWNWAFGDGINSAQQSPVHIYSAAGNYAVNLTVSNANGSNSKLATISVSLAQLEQPVLPVASFTSNVTSGPAPLGVQFNDNSLNATAWNWAFGDGTNSAQQSPVHIYSAAGNYAVNLTVSNANGSNSKLATISVSVAQLEQPVLPVASFTSNVTSGPAPLGVQFNDNSLNAIAWNWAFGDGTNSAQQSPVHIYSAAGNYAVNLTVSNANGSNSKLAMINVNGT